MKHEDIWRALDTLAAENGLSASGLAKRVRAGRDHLQSVQAPHAGRARPLAEHRKHRQGAGRDRRQPGGLHRAGVRRARAVQRERQRGAQHHAADPADRPGPGGRRRLFDDGGYPVGGGWDEVSLPEIADTNAYALEISGNSMEPVFRDGDMVIVSPAAPIRRGDRVVVRTTSGEVMAKQLARRSARRVELKSLNPEHPRPQLRPDRGRLDSSDRLGQPVARQGAGKRSAVHRCASV